MADWLPAALAYIPQWVAYQQRNIELPGISIAIARHDKLVLEAAFGVADLAEGTKLTPAHQFRVASHSKTFTAVGIMRLVEAGRIGLDDRASKHVSGLHKDVGQATIRQLLSHTAGIIRDGLDIGQWTQRRPFLNEAELRAELTLPPILPANTRMKYTNHGFGLLGLVIEAATGTPYQQWIAREVVAPAGLRATFPDVPTPDMRLLSQGHGTKILLGKRPVIPTDTPTNALAAATGFVSTAADLVKFFAQLDPAAKSDLLSVESRREMTRRHWPVPDMAGGRFYGLGTIHADIGVPGEVWACVGHSGGFPGMTTHTMTIPSQNLTISALTNAADGMPALFFDGIVRIMQACAKRGPATPETADWTGRWWGPMGAVDLLPLGDTVMVAAPGQWNPLADISELKVTSPDQAIISKAGGFASHGEQARLLRNRAGKVTGLYLSGAQLQTERAAAKEVQARYFGD